MLESEAKEKLCPFATNFGEESCVGSRCMAWRWIPAGASTLFKDAANQRAKQLGYAHQCKARIEDVAYRNPPDGIDYDLYDGTCGMIIGRLDPPA